ncbi:glycosyltransferase [Ramlibacter sp. AW1]|uniref:Glycosyltransferase n=1 Tax=Ramlibacter aurantiacus TaxID=2801330 RepID=A0A937D6F5_9BURK|nr:glycosyltransferase [Ramlibacter aurantiacus]MBL0422272.1 glycosyltransferase [Ramlibacter aurantiacus]
MNGALPLERPLRVLHVYKSYYPDTVGGIEQVIAQLGRGLNGLGVESRIFTLSRDPQPPVIELPEGKVHRTRQSFEVASNNVSVSALRDFGRHVDWADVVHYQFPWPFGDVLHLLAGHRKPSIVSYQSDVVRQRWLMRAYRPLMNRFLGSVDRVVATSPEYLRSSAVLANLSTPVTVIPNGVDEGAYPQPDSQAIGRWRARLGEGFFLFVGVLRYYKGLHVLVQAARNFPGRVVIAGEGPERPAIEKKVRSLGLDNVTLLGRVSDEDKMCLLQLCRAFAFPSHLRSEAFGMSLVEAAMCSKPMISCGIGTGTSFINLDGQTGYVVEPESPQALHDALVRLQQDASLASAMGARARTRYENFFTASAMATAYLEAYRQVLPAPAPAGTR